MLSEEKFFQKQKNFDCHKLRKTDGEGQPLDRNSLLDRRVPDGDRKGCTNETC